MIFLDPRNNMRAGGESQHPGLGQSQALPTARKVSSIPRADHTPGHQENAGSNNWVYPSEQMFFNAMQRKGWNPSERDMSSVVAIHNAVNERTWSEVMKWEKMHCAVCTQPRLVKFHGRPTDYSPKARLYSLFGYKLPFDRHDWVIDRCGTPVRYVIDFYVGKPDDKHAISYYLDVRPALDDWRSVVDRVRMNLNSVLPQQDGSASAKPTTSSGNA